MNGTSADADSSAPSHIVLKWFGGGYEENVSYQLVGADSNGVSAVRHIFCRIRDALAYLGWPREH